jgi:hypothetical protein
VEITVMKRPGRRLAVVVAAALAPMAYVTVAAPAIGWADCENGAWWDPVANVCREGVAPQPVACDFGSVWNPLNNACLPILPPPR